MAVVAVMGVIIERLAYRPLRNAPRLAALISAIGVSILLQNVAQAIFGSQQVPFPDIPLFTTAAGAPKAFALGGVQITYFQVFVVVVTVTAMLLLNLYVRRTRMGRAMRASAQDKNTSALMGVNVNKVIALTFLIGSAMGALAGGLYGGVYHAAWPLMGFNPGLKAFIAAVLGGIGNIPGAFLGGLLLGVIEALGSAYLPMGSQYRDAIAFVILILILSFRPSGLLGSTVSQKA
jgi:branched-chain amino acid transport system permease protein